MIGIRLVQHFDDRVFGIAIDVGHEIVALLFDDVQRVDAIHRAHHDLSRATAGAKRHVDHCVHEEVRKGGTLSRGGAISTQFRSRTATARHESGRYNAAHEAVSRSHSNICASCSSKRAIPATSAAPRAR